MYETWTYEALEIEAQRLRAEMLDIDAKLTQGKPSLDQRDFERWRKNMVAGKQERMAALMKVKLQLQVQKPPAGQGNRRRFWRGLCLGLARTLEAVRADPAAPEEIRQKAEGALSDFALAMVADPEDSDEVAS